MTLGWPRVPWVGCKCLAFCWCLWVAHIFLGVEELQLHICKILQGEMDHSLIFVNSFSKPRFVKENAVNALLKFYLIFIT